LVPRAAGKPVFGYAFIAAGKPVFGHKTPG
jgi:hypothetical protein